MSTEPMQPCLPPTMTDEDALTVLAKHEDEVARSKRKEAAAKANSLRHATPKLDPPKPVTLEEALNVARSGDGAAEILASLEQRISQAAASPAPAGGGGGGAAELAGKAGWIDPEEVEPNGAQPRRGGARGSARRSCR